jgi:ABC-type Na+ efflux pump permease subunit
VAGVNAASSIGHERTQGSLDLIRCSPLTAKQIVRGKMGGILRGLSLLILFPLSLLGFRFVLHISTEQGAAIGAPLLGIVALLAVVGTWMGIGFRVGIATLDTRRAVIRFAVVLGILGIGLPLLCALLLEGFNIRGSAEDFIGGMLLGPCPPVAAGMGPYALDEHLSNTHSWRRQEPSVLYWGVAWIVLHLWFAIREWEVLPGRLARKLEEERRA